MTTRREMIAGATALIGGFAMGKPIRGAVGARGANQASAAGWQNPYVTDGLVAMWDGEWNLAGGVHEANTTVWKDLSGNGYDLALGKSSQFGVCWCETAGGNPSLKVGCRTEQYVDGIVQMEAVFASPSGENVCAFGMNVDGGNGPSANVLGLALNGDSVWTGKIANSQYGVLTSLASGTPHSISSAYSTSGDVYVDGQWLSKRKGPTVYYNAGGVLALFSTGYTAYSIVACRVYCARLYSRPLSESEITRNNLIDKRRFGI